MSRFPLSTPKSLLVSRRLYRQRHKHKRQPRTPKDFKRSSTIKKSPPHSMHGETRKRRRTPKSRSTRRSSKVPKQADSSLLHFPVLQFQRHPPELPMESSLPTRIRFLARPSTSPTFAKKLAQPSARC